MKKLVKSKITDKSYVRINAGTKIQINASGWVRNGPNLSDTLNQTRVVRGITRYDEQPDYASVYTERSIFVVSINDLELIDVPSASKEQGAFIVLNSIWSPKEDIYLISEDVFDIDSPHPYAMLVERTLPAGTLVKVVSKKSRLSVHSWDKVMDVEVDGHPSIVSIPLRFFSKMELAVAGKEKTYWKLVDKNGNNVTNKRFDNLGNVKASVRFKTGCMKIDWNSSDPQPPIAADPSEIIPFNEWKAIQYRSVDNSVIQTEELTDWYIMHVLADKH